MVVKTKKEFESLPSGTRFMFAGSVGMLMVTGIEGGPVTRSLMIGPYLFLMVLHEDGFQLIKSLEGFMFTSRVYCYTGFSIISDQN